MLLKKSRNLSILLFDLEFIVFQLSVSMKFSMHQIVKYTNVERLEELWISKYHFQLFRCTLELIPEIPCTEITDKMPRITGHMASFDPIDLSNLLKLHLSGIKRVWVQLIFQLHSSKNPILSLLVLGYISCQVDACLDYLATGGGPGSKNHVDLI